MSAMTVPVPQAHRLPAPSTQPCTIVRATASADWRLTDRGIAVIMVIAVMILTAALAVIGLTAVRVTSPDYGADVHESQLDQH